jgi:flagellar biosynthesis anti-sigma factor FlgM
MGKRPGRSTKGGVGAAAADTFAISQFREPIFEKLAQVDVLSAARLCHTSRDRNECLLAKREGDFFMQISGVSQLHGAQALSGPHSASRSASADASSDASGAADELQLSSAAQFASLLNDVPDVRQDRVSQLRAAIQSGTYETQDRLNGAVDRLLDEIG